VAVGLEESFWMPGRVRYDGVRRREAMRVRGAFAGRGVHVGLEKEKETVRLRGAASEEGGGQRDMDISKQ